MIMDVGTGPAWKPCRMLQPDINYNRILLVPSNIQLRSSSLRNPMPHSFDVPVILHLPIFSADCWKKTDGSGAAGGAVALHRHHLLLLLPPPPPSTTPRLSTRLQWRPLPRTKLTFPAAPLPNASGHPSEALPGGDQAALVGLLLVLTVSASRLLVLASTRRPARGQAVRRRQHRRPARGS